VALYLPGAFSAHSYAKATCRKQRHFACSCRLGLQGGPLTANSMNWTAAARVVENKRGASNTIC
jgi:hypothetical protein